MVRVNQFLPQLQLKNVVNNQPVPNLSVQFGPQFEVVWRMLLNKRFCLISYNISIYLYRWGYILKLIKLREKEKLLIWLKIFY